MHARTDKRYLINLFLLNYHYSIKDEQGNLLDQGIIEESTSPRASPIVMIPKADGSLRLCTDFRKVNNPDPFPLPRIEDLTDRVWKAKHLTKLDMTSS